MIPVRVTVTNEVGVVLGTCVHTLTWLQGFPSGHEKPNGQMLIEPGAIPASVAEPHGAAAKQKLAALQA